MTRVTLNPKKKGVKRPYRAPRRQAQAEATRQAILDAAHDLFIANGYASTSIRAVAQQAQVSDQTVYTSFGDKPSLLTEVGLRVISGTGEHETDNDFAAALADSNGLDQRIAIGAAEARRVWEGGMLEFEAMLLDAAASEPRAADLAQQMWQRKYDENKRIFEVMIPRDVLPVGVDFDQAYDVFFALDSAAFTRILIEDRNWDWDTYQHWFATIIRRLFTTLETTDNP